MKKLGFILVMMLAGKMINAQCDTAAIYNTLNANAVCFDTLDNVLKCYSNNYPDHDDSYNSPFTVAASEEEYSMCFYPDTAVNFTPLYEETETTVGCTWTYAFGVSTNGVKYDPNSAVYFEDTSGANNLNWHVEARYIFSGNFGNNGGHLNPFGEYHYHDVPKDYFEDSLGITGTGHSPIVGYAADGFPIYYKYAYADPLNSGSGIVELTSGYTLKTGTRPGDGFTAPNGSYTGLYYEDYEYAADTLDSCNGRFGITPEYPNGTYYYVLTDNYPYIPRCFKGAVVDHSYRVGPGAACPSSTAATSCDTASNFSIGVSGCTDPFACNYDPSATTNNGSCYYMQYLDTTIAVACDQRFWRGMSFNASGTYYDTVSPPNGCTGVATLILTVLNSTSASFTATACANYTWLSNTYTTSGVYHDTISNSVGCDSILTLNLTIGDTVYGSESVVACNSYAWQGNTYSSSGSYIDTLLTAGGCDSIATLNLTISAPSTSNENETACDSFTWALNSATYTTTGTYSDTLTNVSGCDSVVTLNLTIVNSSSSSETQSACDSYAWNGTTYTASGVYSDTLSNALGCDSVATLNLTIHGAEASSETASACDAYTWSLNSTTYTTSGSYQVTLNNSSGCDSVVTLNLTVNGTSSSSETQSACGSYTWAANSVTYTSSGTHTVTLTNSNGCDSVATLNLTINNATSATQIQVACDSYTWPVNSSTYTTSGTYLTTLTNAAGCDSIITLNLTINSSSTASENVFACTSYTWPASGITYGTTGIYNVTLTNSAGCDSAVTLNLTIGQNSNSMISVMACDSFYWLGSTYTSSGSFTDTLVNAVGCDSVVTLNLQMNTTGYSAEVKTSCGPFFWHGTLYTDNGVYLDTLPKAGGCDSIVTLMLTVNHPTFSEESVEACNEFVWLGQNINTSGTYMDTIPNAAGCDSILTLNLSVVSIDRTVIDNSPELVSNQSGAQYQWLDCLENFAPIAGATNQNFVATENGEYAVEVVNMGCSDTSLCAEVKGLGSYADRTSFDQAVSIYPNPTTGIIIYELKESDWHEAYLFNASGQLLITNESMEAKGSLDLTGFEPGVYLLRVQLNNRSIMGKVILH